jgi:SulP family sulfate permease
VILALRRLAPVVPGSLVAVLLDILAVKLLSLDHHGVSIVGPIKSGLPTFGTPNVHLRDFGTLVAGGIGVMLVGFAEGLGAAKTYAAREHYEIDANRELLGLGGANIAAGLSSGMVVNGSLSKTAVNGSAGARTQLSGLIVAALTILTLLALTGLFEDLPEATLAAIVIAAVIELVDYRALTELYRAHTERLGREFGFASRPDFIAAVAALLGVTVFDTLPGLFIGIGISLLLIYRASRPYIATLGREPGPDGRYSDIDRHPDNELPSHAVVLRIESSLYFANADAIRARIMHAAEMDGITAVILDAQTIPFIDVTAARMLATLAEDLDRREVRLLLARDIGQVRDIVHSVIDNPAITHFYPTVQAAVAAAQKTT